MKISIIIPAYNERKTILEILRRLEAVSFSHLNIDKEIIIIDDGSTDGTREILKSLIGCQYLRVIFLSRNQGKGAALRRGFQEAKGEIITIQDADLEYNPEDLPNLIQPILKGRTKIVYGSRFSIKHKPRRQIFYLGNQLLTFLFWFFYGKTISDPWTCYKVFRRDLLKNLNLKSNGFELEIELTAKFLRSGYQILELPISYQSRTYAEGKKIRLRDGFKAIWTVIKYRYFY